MTDWNTIQVARNRVAETAKPPTPISVYPVASADAAAGATWETAGDPAERRYEFDCSSIPDGATVTKVDLGLGGKTIPVRFVNCRFLPPHAHTGDYCEWCATGQAQIVRGGQGRSAERVGHSGTMLVILTAVAIAYAALAYFVWPTLVKIF